MDFRQLHPARHQRSTSTPDTDMMGTPNYQQGMRSVNDAIMSSGGGGPQPSSTSGSTSEVFCQAQQYSYYPNSIIPSHSGDRFQDFSMPTSTNETERIPPRISTSCLSNNDSDLDSIERVPQSYERTSTAATLSPIAPFQSRHSNHPVNAIVCFGSSRAPVELKRPDSVITTSSIVSSSDTEHSQAGDSSTESSGGSSVLSATAMGTPSVYAMSGLYGAAPATYQTPASVKANPKNASAFNLGTVSHGRQQAAGPSYTQPSHPTLNPITPHPPSAISSTPSNLPTTIGSLQNTSKEYKQNPQFVNSQPLHHDLRGLQPRQHTVLAKSNSSSAAANTSSFVSRCEQPKVDGKILSPDTSKCLDLVKAAKLEGRIRTISLQQPSFNDSPKAISSSNRLGTQDSGPTFINTPSSCLIKRHRRQKSYPVTFQPIPLTTNVVHHPHTQAANDTKVYTADINYKSTNPSGGGIESIGIEAKSSSSGGGTVVTLVRHGSNPVNGHRRSHSYGPQRPPSHLIHPGHLQAQLGHRRAGSSVIETLQNLTGSCGHGDPNYNSKEASLAQFLEMLKKEQQEK